MATERSLTRPGAADRYPAVPWAHARLYRAFVIVALLAGPEMGFLLGAGILTALAAGGGDAMLGPLINAHGTLQLLGFAGLFVIGISFHVVPRFRGSPPMPHPAPQHTVLALVTGGVLVRATAQAWTGMPLRDFAMLGSSLAVAAGLLVYAAVITLVLRRGTRQRRPVDHWIALGLAGSVAMTGALLAGAVGHRSSADALLRQVTVEVFLLPFTFAVSSRAVAGLAGLRDRSDALDRIAWMLVATGAGASVAGELIAAPTLVRFAAVLTPVGWLAFIASLRVFEPASRPEAGTYPRLLLMARLAYVSLAIAAVLRLGGIEPTLHVITLGTISTMIVGFAARVIPLFEQSQLTKPAQIAADATTATLTLASLARALQVAVGLPIAWVSITSVSAAVAMAVFGATFLGYLRLSRWPPPAPTEPQEPPG